MRTIAAKLVMSFLLISPVALCGQGPATTNPGENKAAEASAVKTIEALQGAYTRASVMSEYFARAAKKADEEGYAGAACLLRASSTSEKVHAAMYAAQITAHKGTATIDKAVTAPEVKTTRENLAAALKLMNAARETDLPAARKAAEGEGHRDTARAIRDAREGVIEIARALKDCGETLDQWKSKRDFFVGRTCGYMIEKLDLQKCPVCGKGRDDFEKIN